MLRLGMIGADSSHTELYGGLLAPGGPLAHRAAVVKLWGEDRAQAREKAAQLHIAEVVDHPADAVAGVDAVLVHCRYGDDHAQGARLALQAGRPTFVDKPFVNDLFTARDLARLSKESGAPLMSCSSLRYANEMQELQAQQAGFGPTTLVSVVGPAAGSFPNPRATHPFFYGVHATELLHTLMGSGATSVTTHRTPGCDVAVVSYPEGRQGVLNLIRRGPAVYQAAIYGKDGWGQMEIKDHSSYYHNCMVHILDMFETGHNACPIEWAVEIVAILTALVQSAAAGGQTVRVSSDA